MTTTMNTGAASLSDEQRTTIQHAADKLRTVWANHTGDKESRELCHKLEALIATPTPQAYAAPSELASMTRMFHAACADLGAINEALGLDPDDGGAAPILDAIAELKSERDKWVDAGYAASANASQADAAIAAGGAQEPVAWMYSSTRGVDLGRMRWSDDMKALGPDDMVETPLYAAPLPREAATVAPEVIAWRDAYQAYVDATAQYNSHLEYVRAHCPFGTSVDAQYQAMNEAQRKAFALLKPMHAALMADASNGEQA